jgi:hypothetical protein
VATFLHNPMQNNVQRITMNPLKLFSHLPKPFLVLVAAYFLTSLGHFAVAHMAHHTLSANITILSDVGAAALLLPVAVYLLVGRLHGCTGNSRASIATRKLH